MLRENRGCSCMEEENNEVPERVVNRKEQEELLSEIRCHEFSITELALYLEELKREYMRILKRGNVYAVDVMHDKYKATVAIYKDHVSFMKELLAKQKAKQQIPKLIIK